MSVITQAGGKESGEGGWTSVVSFEVCPVVLATPSRSSKHKSRVERVVSVREH